MESSWGFSPPPTPTPPCPPPHPRLAPPPTVSSKSCSICCSLDRLPAVLSPATPVRPSQGVKPPTLRCKISKANQLAWEGIYYIFLLLSLYFAQKASFNFLFFPEQFFKLYLQFEWYICHWNGSPCPNYFLLSCSKKHNLLNVYHVPGPLLPPLHLLALQVFHSPSSSHFSIPREVGMLGLTKETQSGWHRPKVPSLPPNPRLTVGWDLRVSEPSPPLS